MASPKISFLPGGGWGGGGGDSEEARDDQGRGHEGEERGQKGRGDKELRGTWCSHGCLPAPAAVGSDKSRTPQWWSRKSSPHSSLILSSDSRTLKRTKGRLCYNHRRPGRASEGGGQETDRHAHGRPWRMSGGSKERSAAASRRGGRGKLSRIRGHRGLPGPAAQTAAQPTATNPMAWTSTNTGNISSLYTLFISLNQLILAVQGSLMSPLSTASITVRKPCPTRQGLCQMLVCVAVKY